MYSGNYYNNCFKGGLFPGDVNGGFARFRSFQFGRQVKRHQKVCVSFRTRILSGRGLRKYKSMFSWPQYGRSTGNAFKQVLNFDRRKQKYIVLQSNVEYYLEAEFNLLGTIGNATADKMTRQNSEMSSAKTSSFRFNLKNLKFKHVDMQRSSSAKL